MPISQSQHRSSTGKYQSKFHEKSRDPISPTPNMKENLSDIQGGIYNMTSLINNAENSLSALNIQNNTRPFRKNAVSTTLQLMLLLNHIRPTDTVSLTARGITLSTISNNLSSTAINSSLPERQKIKRDVTNTYDNKQKKINVSNKTDESLPIDTTMAVKYGLQNKIFIKAVDTLIKEHQKTLIKNNENKKENTDNIAIKNNPSQNGFKFPVLNLIIATEKGVTKEEQNQDKPTIKKLDYNCLEDRKNMTLPKLFRKIGDTLSNPVTELAKEIQVIYFYQKTGQCGPKESVESLKKATLLADKIFSSIISVIPHFNNIVLLTNIGGPLFRLMADDIENKELNPDDMQDLTSQAAFISKSIVESSPKNSDGEIIENKISLPKNIFFQKNKIQKKTDKEEFNFSYEKGKYITKKDNIVSETTYSKENKAWQPGSKKENIEKILFGKREVFNIIKTKKLLSQLSIKNGDHKRIDEIKDYSLYHTEQSNGKSLVCIKIDDKFIPMRSGNKKIGGNEIYDHKKPNKIGYPVYLGEDRNWHFGRSNTILMKGDANLQLYPYVSTYLHQSIHPSLYETDINPHNFQPIDNRGIVKLQYGKKYLKLKDGYIRINNHPLFPHLFELGPEQSDKRLCYFDKSNNKFYSVPEEKNISGNDRVEEYVNNNKETPKIELMIKFKNQRALKTYREGFRGLNFEDYKKIDDMDEYIARESNKIHLYGLNKEEIAQNIVHEEIAQKIKNDVINSQEITKTVKELLINSEKNPHITDYLNKTFIIKNNKKASNYIRKKLINNISKTDNILRQHITDDCSRVWLIDHKNIDIYGLTNINDPLNRLYVNLKRSDAFIQKNRKSISCKLFCSISSEGDDMATIIHEASHSGAKTIDSFYMVRNTLESELERLYAGDMSKNEISDILNSNAASKAPLVSGSAMERASNLFNNDPNVRGEFLINNADSFTQIILDLYDKGSKISKRDAHSPKGINAEILYLFVTQGLSEKKYHL